MRKKPTPESNESEEQQYHRKEMRKRVTLERQPIRCLVCPWGKYAEEQRKKITEESVVCP